MKATQKEAREDLMECATAILEDVVLLDCLLESMNQILQGILDRLWSYIDHHTDDVRSLSSHLTGGTATHPA